MNWWFFHWTRVLWILGCWIDTEIIKSNSFCLTKVTSSVECVTTEKVTQVWFSGRLFKRNKPFSQFCNVSTCYYLLKTKYQSEFIVISVCRVTKCDLVFSKKYTIILSIWVEILNCVPYCILTKTNWSPKAFIFVIYIRKLGRTHY